MKNKKATLQIEELLKIFIALICIGFLIILITAVYFLLTGEQKRKEAEASMKDSISKEITRINDNGEYTSQGIPVPNPSGWYIFGFVGEDLKPNSCTGNNCVCICENVLINIFDWQKRQIKKCDDKGSCVVVFNLKKFDKIKIEKGGVAILIRKVNNEIQITRK